MRVVDAQEAIVVDEELTGLQELVHVLPTVQHLNVVFNSLTSLAGLDQAVQLRNLNLSHNAIASIQEIAQLTNLQILKCSHNEIADLSWVSALHALRELWVHENRIESPQIAHLQPLSQLQTLVLHPNPCTELSSYITDVVRALPWLERLDTVVVNQALRDEARHAAERETLSTGSTDYSISLLSDRSDDSKPSTPVLSPPKPVLITEKPVGKKKTKQEIAEDFMRNFPVQDYIPVQESEAILNQDLDPANHALEPQQALSKSYESHEAQTSSPSPLKSSGEPATESVASLFPPEHQQQEAIPLNSHAPVAASISSIASAVLSLPTFTSDGFLSKAKPAQQKPRAPLVKKKSSAKATKYADPATEASTPATTSFKQDEWLLTYPNTTITAVHVRADGSAIAKWPNGSIAVSVDRETRASDCGSSHGFRVYAAHKDSQIALSFDCAGVGFINYHPSGKMLISTTSSGDGLYFSSDSAKILRQWDKDANLRDENFEATEALGDEDDGSLLLKLSDGIGVRVQLVRCDSGSTSKRGANPIQLCVYFATTCGIRYLFRNSVNTVGAEVVDGSDACDCVFGKQVVKSKRNESSKPPQVPHADLLQDIRASVASLQL